MSAQIIYNFLVAFLAVAAVLLLAGRVFAYPEAWSASQKSLFQRSQTAIGLLGGLAWLGALYAICFRITTPQFDHGLIEQHFARDLAKFLMWTGIWLVMLAPPEMPLPGRNAVLRFGAAALISVLFALIFAYGLMYGTV